MDGLSPAKAGLLRMLIDGAPDGVLRKLEQALGDETVRDGPLGTVWALVERESRDRGVRDTVLAPIVGLFHGPLAQWPPAVLPRLWTHLKTAHPVAVTMAAASAQAYDPDAIDPTLYDAVCALAVADLQAGGLAGIDGDQAERLIAALNLAPIVRRCLPHLGDWLARMDQERRAAVRVAYRDSVALSPDDGPLFFSMLASRLPDPDRILRIISAVMDRPSERYFAGSELAPFGVRLLDGIDAHLAEVRNFDTSGGEEAGRAAGRAVHRAAQAIAELDEGINLSKEGEWGKRLAQQKRSLALSVEGRLKEIENAVGQALPVQALRYSARLIRSAPKLVGDPDLAAIRKALSLLAFAEEVRSSADTGGFGSTRARILESIEKHIDPYVEDLLEHLRSDEDDNPGRTRAFLEAAADILSLAKDEKAGQIVRRRLAAA
ncbi:hypothetical protein GVN21_08085 [Caulobacter sp. SLTY]|uniref:hypothetical protein n=1 Tax=Caulobacter sp. SLTY TaxID=2683262 RepID=UPI00141327E1|nr:hypothetical protein [Caulobacter sp. SLTY]NBB15313.1 hypothetical protein [Caulobacter sp. SLTY]